MIKQILCFTQDLTTESIACQFLYFLTIAVDVHFFLFDIILFDSLVSQHLVHHVSGSVLQTWSCCGNVHCCTNKQIFYLLSSFL